MTEEFGMIRELNQFTIEAYGTDQIKRNITEMMFITDPDDTIDLNDSSRSDLWKVWMELINLRDGMKIYKKVLDLRYEDIFRKERGVWFAAQDYLEDFPTCRTEYFDLFIRSCKLSAAIPSLSQAEYLESSDILIQDFKQLKNDVIDIQYYQIHGWYPNR